jgi:plasmid maintenance system killer protein
MEITFASRKLQKQFSDEESLKKSFNKLSGRLKLRYDLLEAADCLADVSHEPPPRRHLLKGEWKGHFALDVSGNWRLVFRPLERKVTEGMDLREVTAIEIVAVIDYH